MYASLLIVDDEKNIRTTLSRSLSLENYRCASAATLDEARRSITEEPPDLVMLDVKLPDGNGMDLLVELKKAQPDLPVIMMSGHGTIDLALEAIRRGAHDFIEKPLATERILITLANALRFEGQRRELHTLRKRLGEDASLLGGSMVMQQLRELIARAAPSNGRVLIRGESGTGKELIARAIHANSRRSKGPFVKLNCAAIPAELIESELFGHERGAFTGAHQTRKGKFELAHEGTLFLDEIGDMRTDVQAKLLRALQEGEVERVGGSRTIRVDVRVVAATHQDLELAITEGTFREDLYYRLNVLPIHAPPLRTHKQDLPELVHAFVARISEDNAMRVELADDAIEALCEHDWPGNVRELRNACERLVILSPGPVVTRRDVRQLLGPMRSAQGALFRPDVPMRDLVAEAERAIITAALDHNGDHVTATAASLGLERSHLYKKMRALGIKR